MAPCLSGGFFFGAFDWTEGQDTELGGNYGRSQAND